jgi:hypothetical protein
VTCAACHVAVDPQTGRVIEGPANPDLNMGLILALAPNSAAYFTRTNVDVAKRHDLFSERSATIRLRDGGTASLPDPQRLEDEVDRIVMHWPPGNFDTMVDLEANPTRIPDSFTRGDHPFGWNGFGQIGPFQGLSTLGNNVHAFNADPTIEAHIAPHVFGIAEETYLAIMLQNAANPRFRFDPAGRRDAKAFLDRINPNPQGPGLSQTATLPSYPDATALVPHGVVVTRAGHPFWSHINAISAFQHSLKPPPPPEGAVDPALMARGRQVFEKAGCNACHFGPAFTSNRVLAASVVGTEPDRAKAFAKTERIQHPGPPVTWAWDTPVPVPAGARALEVPTDHRSAEEMRRILAHDGEGGYKVKGLIGLRFTAPYLHMGGVAVGPDPNVDLGMPGTLLRGVRPDPVNSLFAMIDRGLRARVIHANRSDEMMALFNVRGEGHAFWADGQAGFSPLEQRALVHYLMYLDADENPPAAPASQVAGADGVAGTAGAAAAQAQVARPAVGPRPAPDPPGSPLPPGTVTPAPGGR